MADIDESVYLNAARAKLVANRHPLANDPATIEQVATHPVHRVGVESVWEARGGHDAAAIERVRALAAEWSRKCLDPADAFALSRNELLAALDAQHPAPITDETRADLAGLPPGALSLPVGARVMVDLSAGVEQEGEIVRVVPTDGGDPWEYDVRVRGGVVIAAQPAHVRLIPGEEFAQRPAEDGTEDSTPGFGTITRADLEFVAAVTNAPAAREVEFTPAFDDDGWDSTTPPPSPPRTGRFETLLAAEHEQFDHRGELLKSITEYKDAPSGTVSAPRSFRRCIGCGDDIWPEEPSGDVCAICRVKDVPAASPSVDGGTSG